MNLFMAHSRRKIQTVTSVNHGVMAIVIYTQYQASLELYSNLVLCIPRTSPHRKWFTEVKRYYNWVVTNKPNTTTTLAIINTSQEDYETKWGMLFKISLC